ncbi:MAG: cobalamin-dependent protein, partial [Coriobacteriia bacterium]|nr:cobalamin-dependent protein [Coriobacteriia bacterium]
MSAHYKERVALIEAGSPGLNIYSHVAMGRGIALLATVLYDAGYESRAFIEDISGKGSIDWSWVRGADVVGFSALTCTMPRTRELIERARIENPAATILLGGPESTCNPRRSFEAGADLVLKGEAEFSLPRLLDVLAGRSSEGFADVPGLVWREEGILREGPAPRQLTREELDTLPLVDRSLIHEVDSGSVASVWRARGCPSRCDFCEVCEIWPRY